MELKQALRDWVVQTSRKIDSAQLTDDTPIIEQRIITSLQVMDLILFIEKLGKKSVDVESLKPGVFRNINSIYSNFFAEQDNGK